MTANGALSASEVAELLNTELGKLTIHQRRQQFYSSFDSAAVFLLDWEMSNLFEPASGRGYDDWQWRCKGCTKVIARNERKNHHREHREQYAQIRETE